MDSRTWTTAAVTGLRDESATARTLVLRVPGWRGHRAGQHVDLRLTADDGYTAVRSYSIASEPDPDGTIDLTVEQVRDGEVSPYLAQVLAVGDRIEVRGPLGGWFVWAPERADPVQLIAGGSGIVPLMSMLRLHRRKDGGAPMRLLYATRRPATVIYAEELAAETAAAVTIRYTREAPPAAGEPPGRIDADLLARAALPPSERPTCYVCGPTGFVEATARLLLRAGHDPRQVRTERFGGTA